MIDRVWPGRRLLLAWPGTRPLGAGAARPAWLAGVRAASNSSSSKRWNQRQQNDHYRKEAVLQGLRSRAAYKLLQLDHQYKLFRPGMTVVDLGFAPGSWSQVAVDRTSPGGRVVGVDILPCAPPKGASAIQGNFLAPATQDSLRQYVRDHDRGRPVARDGAAPAYLELEREQAAADAAADAGDAGADGTGAGPDADKVVDLVLSDMSDPWPLVEYPWIRTLSQPHYRMANTSGIGVRDHAMSMDLCDAALTFAVDMLKVDGHFVCKFFSGPEEKLLEARLKRMFRTVKRNKPEASRKASREMFFVATRRKKNVSYEDVYLTSERVW
ncbi:O-ribose methyltransferase [Dipodascopsis tothii]|uniref:O-ribose methyltransferase n=1 Tax=Dipodascopsis tothii TaxID=44089 RepID=UPI0034D00F92